MSKWLLGAFFSVAVLCSYAQDLHFSQFYLSPLNLNPANTGNFDGDWRISGNYRTQWRSLGYPFNTYSLGYDRNFFKKTSRFSGGLLAVHDESGNAQITLNKIMASFAIHPKIGKDEFHIGIQAGLTMKAFQIDGLTFPSQFDPISGTFNGQLPNGEQNINLKLNQPDVNLGLAWSRNLGADRIKGGFALLHLNRPNESFFGGSQKVALKKLIHLEYALALGNHLQLNPKFLNMWSNKASEMVLGCNLALLFGENKLHITSLYGGGSLRTGIGRNTDAAIATAGLSFERMEFGLSYDTNISSLQTATNRKGALEVALIFWSGTNQVKPKTLPCDRF